MFWFWGENSFFNGNFSVYEVIIFCLHPFYPGAGGGHLPLTGLITQWERSLDKNIWHFMISLHTNDDQWSRLHHDYHDPVQVDSLDINWTFMSSVCVSTPSKISTDICIYTVNVASIHVCDEKVPKVTRMYCSSQIYWWSNKRKSQNICNTSRTAHMLSSTFSGHNRFQKSRKVQIWHMSWFDTANNSKWSIPN